MNYSRLILDHFHSPRFNLSPPALALVATAVNSVCADRITLWFNPAPNPGFGFTAQGCGLSIAAASILCEWLNSNFKEPCAPPHRVDFFQQVGPIPEGKEECCLVAWRAWESLAPQVGFNS